MKRPEDGLDRTIQRDLEAFGRVTGREIRAVLAKPARTVRPRTAAWLGAAAAVVIMVALLFVPVTYATVAGQQLIFSVPWPLTEAARAEVIRGLRAVVRVESIRVEAAPEGMRLTALIPDLSERRARADVEAFARHIRADGAEAIVSIQPAMTTDGGNVYGFAVDRLRRLLVDVRGRTSDEIEQDVRQRLEAIGFREAEVSVQHDGGRTDIKFRATDGQGRVEENEYRRELRGKGEPPFELPMPDLSDLDQLPLEQRRDAIEKRLRDLGIEARVTIENGRLRVDAVHDVIKRPNQR